MDGLQLSILSFTELSILIRTAKTNVACTQLCALCGQGHKNVQNIGSGSLHLTGICVTEGRTKN